MLKNTRFLFLIIYLLTVSVLAFGQTPVESFEEKVMKSEVFKKIEKEYHQNFQHELAKIVNTRGLADVLNEDRSVKVEVVQEVKRLALAKTKVLNSDALTLTVPQRVIQLENGNYKLVEFSSGNIELSLTKDNPTKLELFNFLAQVKEARPDLMLFLAKVNKGELKILPMSDRYKIICGLNTSLYSFAQKTIFVRCADDLAYQAMSFYSFILAALNEEVNNPKAIKKAEQFANKLVKTIAETRTRIAKRLGVRPNEVNKEDFSLEELREIHRLNVKLKTYADVQYFKAMRPSWNKILKFNQSLIENDTYLKYVVRRILLGQLILSGDFTDEQVCQLHGIDPKIIVKKRKPQLY